MCPSGAACLPEDCCCTELGLKSQTKHVCLVRSRHYHHFIRMLWKSYKIANLAIKKNHSLTPILFWNSRKYRRRRTYYKTFISWILRHSFCRWKNINNNIGGINAAVKCSVDYFCLSWLLDFCLFIINFWLQIRHLQSVGNSNR